ncbi:MAG TPA: hypothetical protein PLD20_34195, partial [Blastocatellia bacterium]|nr:hypothetical protein [Blastocatellia bacterium]
MTFRHPKSVFLLSLILLLGVFVLSGLALMRSPFDESPEFGEADEREGEGRESWFYEQRAYPLKHIPAGARLKALQAADDLEERHRQKLSFSSAFSPAEQLANEQAQLAWQALGPLPIGQQIGRFPINFGDVRVACSGRISAIALHPQYNGTTNQTVYLGSAMGGIWRTNDNGATWIPLTDNQPSLAIGDIAI